MSRREKELDFAREYIALCKKHNFYIQECCCSWINKIDDDEKFVINLMLKDDKNLTIDIINQDLCKNYLTDEFEIH